MRREIIETVSKRVVCVKIDSDRERSRSRESVFLNKRVAVWERRIPSRNTAGETDGTAIGLRAPGAEGNRTNLGEISVGHLRRARSILADPRTHHNTRTGCTRAHVPALSALPLTAPSPEPTASPPKLSLGPERASEPPPKAGPRYFNPEYRPRSLPATRPTSSANCRRRCWAAAAYLAPPSWNVRGYAAEDRPNDRRLDFPPRLPRSRPAPVRR